MGKSPFIFIANWKMQKTFNDSVQFLMEHAQELQQVTETMNSTLILCPSFLALHYFSTNLKNSSLLFGAQNCSAHNRGSYTGQIDAESLAQINCNYCIVGHSEARTSLHEANHDIVQKTTQLITHNITPIVCIGETENEYYYKQTKQVLYEQIMPILEIDGIKTLYIAYEPLWAIGSGKTATPAYIEDIVQALREWVKPFNFFKDIILIYGGSVNEENITSIASIQVIDGVLIGSASLDFKKLKNIVLLHKSHT